MDEEKPIPEIQHSPFAVRYWPREVLWLVAFLAAVWTVVRIDDFCNRQKIAGRRTMIGPASAGPIRQPLPCRDWEDKLKRVNGKTSL